MLKKILTNLVLLVPVVRGLGIPMKTLKELPAELVQSQEGLWLPNSRTDSNPVDYSVWGLLQERVYRTRIADLDELKLRLRTEWANMDHAVAVKAIHQWCRRLRACIQAKGGQFEHRFRLCTTYVS